MPINEREIRIKHLNMGSVWVLTEDDQKHLPMSSLMDRKGEKDPEKPRSVKKA